MLKNIPLLKHQKPMLKTIAKILAGSVKKANFDIPGEVRSDENIQKISAKFTMTPPESIVNKYHQWLNCTAKYQNTVAPHLYPQWAIPELFKLGESLSLPFHKILNQGCKIKVNGDLPKNQNLMGKVQLLDIKEHDDKIRINQKIWTGPKENPIALEAEIYAVILKSNKKSFKKKRKNSPIDISALKYISSVFVSRDDARNYGLISGDINPIHMSKAMAKLFGLNNSLMHGFGLKGIIFEELERHGLQISELELKFLRPVYLDKNIHIYVQKNQENYGLKVLDEDKKSIHLLGSFIVKT